MSHASSKGSIEPLAEELYENPNEHTLTSIPLPIDELGSHIQKLQREEDGFKEEFDVRSLLYPVGREGGHKIMKLNIRIKILYSLKRRKGLHLFN